MCECLYLDDIVMYITACYSALRLLLLVVFVLNCSLSSCVFMYTDDIS